MIQGGNERYWMVVQYYIKTYLCFFVFLLLPSHSAISVVFLITFSVSHTRSALLSFPQYFSTQRFHLWPCLKALFALSHHFVPFMQCCSFPMWGRAWSRTSEWKIMNVVVSCVFPRYTFPQCTIDVCLCFRISIKTMTESVIQHLSSMLLFSCILKYPFILSVCCEDVCMLYKKCELYVCV